MKIFVNVYSWLAFSLFFTPLFFSSQLTATDCSEEVLFRFFPKIYVIEVLQDRATDAANQKGLSNEQIDAIAKELGNKDRDVVQMIEERASKMSPNPLLDQGANKERAELFKGVLLDIFTQVMNKNGISDENEIKEMLNEIQELRIERFEECKKEGRLPELPSPPPPARS